LLIKTKQPLLASLLINEPIIQRQSDFAKVFLRQHIFVPYNEFDDAELIIQRKKDWEIEGGTYVGLIVRLVTGFVALY
jgi:hypothetical protein